MKKDKYSEAKKRFFELEAKLSENAKAQKELGWIELDEPIFNGYSRTFILRDDISNRSDAHIYQDLIDNLGVTVYSRKKDFIHKNRNGVKYQVSPYFKNISADRYGQLSPRLQREFSIDYDSSTMQRGQYSYQVNTPNFFFELKRKKEYITKVHIFDGDLKKEEADLERQLKFVNPRIHINWRTKDRYAAPKWFRKRLHKSNKTRSKAELHNVMKEIGEGDFYYNDKDAAWWYR